MSQSGHLKKCLNEIEKTFNRGDHSNWNDHDYILLSEQIFEKTGVTLSKNTLKNIFRKISSGEEYTPQPATRDAIAIYIGYSNWYEYVESCKKQGTREKKESSSRPIVFPGINARFLIPVIMLVVLGYFAVSGMFNADEGEWEFSFEADQKIGTTPHTVRFSYDISKLPHDSIFIDHLYEHHNLGYQKRLLDKESSFLNHTYQIPGNYFVKLIADDKTLSTTKIHVESDGWIGLIGNRFSELQARQTNLKPPEFKHLVFDMHHIFSDPFQGDTMYLSPEQVVSHGFNPNYYWTEFRNIRYFDVEADSMQLDVTFRNSADQGGISCFDSQFIVQGETGYIKITLVEPGCYRFANAVVDGKVYSGETEDLSGFQFDLSKWRTLSLNSHNDSICFFMDDQLFWKKPLEKPIGRISGLVFSFKGSGAISSVDLATASE